MPGLLCSGVYDLHHLDVDVDAGWQRQVGERLNDLRSRIEDVDHALMHPHLELFSRIFVHEGRAIDGVLLDLVRERYGTDHLSIKRSAVSMICLTLASSTL